MENKFKIGDVVHLKSGGSAMTVSQVDCLVHCMWFDNSSNLNEEFFHEDMLRIFEAKEMPIYVSSRELMNKNNIEQESTI